MIFEMAKKRDRAAYFREYRKRKFLNNDMVEVTVYIDRELRDRFKEILRDANMTYSEWFENAIKVEVEGGVLQ